MTNVEALKKFCPKSLGGIRQRLGAEDEADDGCDDVINHMDAENCTRVLSGWLIGDESWASMFIHVYNTIRNKEN